MIQFNSPAEYYHTFFHEMAHSTGHESRLDRLESSGFGSDPYAREELVAELTAAFLSNAHGIFATAEENSKAYFKHWAEKLKADKKLIFKASREAQKAFDLIANV
jgi:antirestriction protein ArdC